MTLQDLVGIDLRGFQGLLKLCRKQGVSEITFGDVVVKFGEMPKKSSEPAEADEPQTPDELTPEQLMFFSVGGQQP